jgi:hypothetical protein
MVVLRYQFTNTSTYEKRYLSHPFEPRRRGGFVNDLVERRSKPCSGLFR